MKSLMPDIVKKKVIWFLYIVIGVKCSAVCQGIQFSQYYNFVQFHNPAYTGTACGLRATMQTRLQWPGLDARYHTFAASIDYNLEKKRSGLGVILLHDVQGENLLSTKLAAVQFAHLVRIKENVSLRAGVSTGFVSRRLDNATLHFPDQFNGTGFTAHNGGRLVRNFIDMDAGLLFSTTQLWLGLGVSHLNNPNQSFINQADRLPRRYNFIGGYKIILREKANMRYLDARNEAIWTLYPSILYKWQGKSDQLETGIYSTYKFFKTGVWFRGLLIKNYSPEIRNSESIVILLGTEFNNFSINYSYDFGLSALKNYSRGAHELNFIYVIPQSSMHRAKRKYKQLPCPGFYGI